MQQICLCTGESARSQTDRSSASELRPGSRWFNNSNNELIALLAMCKTSSCTWRRSWRRRRRLLLCSFHYTQAHNEPVKKRTIIDSLLRSFILTRRALSLAGGSHLCVCVHRLGWLAGKNRLATFWALRAIERSSLA